MSKSGLGRAARPVHQKRSAINAIWQPFLQFKLLMFMLGSTVFIAVILAAFLYFAFSDLVHVVTGSDSSSTYYAGMVQDQLIKLFKYCGILFILYIALLASICILYTHRLVGPLRPFFRHVQKLNEGDYSSRVHLRRTDLPVYNEYADKLNELAVKLNAQKRQAP